MRVQSCKSRETHAFTFSMPMDHQFLLRPWSVDDVAGLREAIDEDLDHLRPWLSWTLEEPATADVTRARLQRFVEEFRSGQTLRHALTPALDPQRILGGVHVRRHGGASACDIGYWVRKSVAGRGIAAAAVSCMVVRAFEELRVDRVVIRCDVENQRSADFAMALGFEAVGEKEGRFPDGSSRALLAFELSIARYRAGVSMPLRSRAASVRISDEDFGNPPTLIKGY